MKNFIAIALTVCSISLWAQTKPDKDLKMDLNDDGSHYLKATFTGQIWLRYNESNPGTVVNGFAQPETYDIGLRRVRAQFFGKVSDRVFFYTQVGINNFGYNTARKPGLFFHDIIGEYEVVKTNLSLGAGLTGWTGFLRYSSPGIASILTYDAPLYQQTTNDLNDQFLRKLSFYMKGKLGRFDYRVIVSKPLIVDTTITTVKKINVSSDFAYTPPSPLFGGYFMYQFMDKESNVLPYLPGTYLGKANVFNIGTGFQYQKNAVWHYGDAVVKDTVYQAMLHYGVDLFFDHKVGTNGAAVTAYAAVSHTDYGKNYVRNNGAMNPATASVGTSFNGGGSAFPTLGTGDELYVQAGYLLPETFGAKKIGRLQPNADFMYSSYDRLNAPVILWNTGFNWFPNGSKMKLSFNYQNRPVFGSIDLKEASRKSMVVMQIQIAL